MPQPGQSHNVGAWIPQPLYKQLKLRAAAEKTSMSALVRDILEKALEPGAIPRDEPVWFKDVEDKLDALHGHVHNRLDNQPSRFRHSLVRETIDADDGGYWPDPASLYRILTDNSKRRANKPNDDCLQAPQDDAHYQWVPALPSNSRKGRQINSESVTPRPGDESLSTPSPEEAPAVTAREQETSLPPVPLSQIDHDLTALLQESISLAEDSRHSSQSSAPHQQLPHRKRAPQSWPIIDKLRKLFIA